MRPFRPSQLLVRLAALGAFGAILAIPLPAMAVPTFAFGAILVALAVIEWIRCWNDPAPRLERIMPARFVKGRAAAVTYRLERPAGGDTVVEVLDELPAALGGDLLIPESRLGQGQRLEVSRELTPSRRGIFDPGPTILSWRSPLGILRLSLRLPAGKGIVVLPAASTAERRSAIDNRSMMRDQLGSRPRPRRGEGREFESLREYVAGDDPRNIDWRASARSVRIQVRQYQTERRHTLIVALDTSRLMGARIAGVTKLDHAINCTAALARASFGLGDRVGIVAFDRQLRLLVHPMTGRAGAGALIEATSPLTPAPFEADYRVLLDTLARNQKKRSLIIVLTDFECGASGELESYLAIVARRHLLMLVALRDRILDEADAAGPVLTSADVYRRLVVQDLVTEREAVLARVRRLGAQVLDLSPEQVTAPVLNRYLAVRDAAMI